MRIKHVLLALLIFVSAAGAQPEERFDFYTRGEYRANVPRPQSILRFDVGDHHTTYAQMERVIEEIAKAAPDRVRIFDLGLTNEHRMMHIVAISSPANIARLDEIKTRNTRLTDPRTTSADESRSIAASNPLIAW